MSFCLQCGSPARQTIPTGDSKQRLVCSNCDYIHYDNPKMICGTLAVHQEQILLCQRAIEPRFGLWTLPAGFMEIGETMQEGALRETLEEAQAIATDAKLYCLFDIPVLGQIHAMYLAKLQDGKYGVGAESLACQLVKEEQIPWENLAFKTISQTLQLYLQDKAKLTLQGQDSTDLTLYPLHQITLSEHR